MEEKKSRIKNSLLIPKTSFSLKWKEEVNEEISEFWEKEEIYKRSLLKKGGNDFILHDGPPYSNGSIHLGHFVNRVLKDIIIRSLNSNGLRTPFLLGWDTHGLPIEQKIIAQCKLFDKHEMRKRCSQYADQQVNNQLQQLKKIGIFTDYQNFYLTKNNDYESKQLTVFSKFVKEGTVYRGERPIYWSWSHQTALAENEVEYLEKEDYSLTFKVKLNEFPQFENKNIKLLVWTTQPWTLIGNCLLAINSQIEYFLVSNEKQDWLIASKNFYDKKLAGNHYQIEKRFEGRDLLGLIYIHPILEKESKVVDGEKLVNEEEGTGILHIAPACGPEDFSLAKKLQIVFSGIVDSEGKFFLEEDPFQFNGVFYQDVNERTIEILRKKAMIFEVSKLTHSYPHDWRDHTPLIYRLTDQWFINLKKFRQKILSNIEKVEWFPTHSKKKMISLIDSHNEWCISRQRSWGVPIPEIILSSGERILIPEIIDFVSKIVKKEGSDFWFTTKAKPLLKEKFSEIIGNDFETGSDTLDIWFDSGSSSLSVLLDQRMWPADIYLEGKDQFRGWFNSSLIISTIFKNNPPYKKVISHGFVVDKDGKKMSKSLGNTLEPLKLINQFGVDTLRTWVSSFDFTKEIKISEDILSSVNDNYQKVRNTLRFIIANLEGFTKIFFNDDQVLEEKLTSVDNYILVEVTNLLERSKENYLKYNFSTIYNEINNLLVNKVSSFYFDIVKDSLYCDTFDNSRRKKVLVTIFLIAQILIKVISPIMPFLAEESYQELRKKENFKNFKFFEQESVHFVEYSAILDKIIDNENHTQFERVFIPLRKEIFKQLEISKIERKISFSLEATVTVVVKEPSDFDFLHSVNNLEELLLVSEVKLTNGDDNRVEIGNSINTKGKCLRCWKFNLKNDIDEFCQRCFSFLS